MQHPPLLSILMPVYNEAKTIHEIIDRVMAADIGGESLGGVQGAQAVPPPVNFGPIGMPPMRPLM